MEFNFTQNVQYCKDIVDAVSGLLYYSHIPSAVVSLLIGFFVLFKSKFSLLGKILFSITLSFSLWVISSLSIWVLYYKNSVVMSAWAPIEIFDILLFILCLYFAYVFIEKKDIKLWVKIVVSLPLIALIFVVPTSFNLTGYDIQECIAIENPVYANYYLGLKIFFSLWIIGFAIYKYFRADKNFRKQILLLTIGMIIFLLSFLVAGYVAEQTYIFMYEAAGLFGMVVFMAFLAYLIVKFKTFNIKVLGAQVLIITIVILVGAQFFFIRNNTNRILTATTLIIAGVVGYNLIRSVKREVEQRERIEKLAGELAVSNEKLKEVNQGQSSLIHFMNHQIKGRFGNIKNIFAELLTDDYGTMPPATMPLIQKGLDESNIGVMYVTNILKGASAEKGTLQYEMKPIDVKTITEEVFSKEKEYAKKKGLQFDLNIESGDYGMSGDSIQLGEAIRNLIDNSINYTPTGSVTVNLSLKDGKILLKVIDTGVGITQEDKERLFKAGGRGINSLKVNVNATGYGLVFVKNVAVAHKGRVWVDSAGHEKGSTFYLELPKN